MEGYFKMNYDNKYAEKCFAYFLPKEKDLIFD